MSVARSITDSIRRLLTSPEVELTRWQRTGRFGIELSIHCARQLRLSRAQQMAAALAYRTVFSIVPVFVLSLIVLRLFYGDDALSGPLHSLLSFAGLAELQLSVEGPDGGNITAADWVASIVQRVSGLNFAAIGVVGMGVLVYAAITLLLEIERSFNSIYRSDTHRPLAARISRSWTVLTLGPIGLLSSFYVGERFRTIVADLGGQSLVALAGVLITFFISWLILLLAFVVVPSARVRLGPAMIGSFIAAALWEAGKFGFREYLDFATGYASIYGSLALLPLFLLWIYITWVIVLFGLQMSHALQTLDKGRRALRLQRDIDEIPADPLFGIAMLVDIARHFQEGKAVAPTDLATRLGASEKGVFYVIRRLREAGLISATLDSDDEEVSGFSLARPANAIEVSEVVRACAPTTGISSDPAVSNLRRAQVESLGSLTLSDVLDGRVSVAHTMRA